MTLDELVNRLPWLTGGAFGIGLLLVLIGLLFFRRSRRAPYWTQRRAAGRQGLRVILLSLFFFSISAVLCGMVVLLGYLDEDEPEASPRTEAAAQETPSATSTPSPVTSPSATLTDIPVSPTDVPSALPTLALTATSSLTATDVSPTLTTTPTGTDTATPPPATLTLTASPSATPTDVPASATPSPSPTDSPSPAPLATEAAPPPTLARTSVVANRTPAPDARLNIEAVSTQISDSWQPLDQAQRFEAGFRRLYVQVSHANVDSGVQWRRELYRDGQRIDQLTTLWGTVSDGQTLFFFSWAEGFAPGEYEVQVYLGQQETPADSLSFTVR